MKKIEALKKDVLRECQDDHVGLWSVVRDVHDYFPDAEDAEVRNTTLTVLGDLLAADLIVAGRPTPDGRRFVRSRKPRTSILRGISTEWERLGRDPSIGEVIWFTAPGTTKTPRSTSSRSR